MKRQQAAEAHLAAACIRMNLEEDVREFLCRCNGPRCVPRSHAVADVGRPHHPWGVRERL